MCWHPFYEVQPEIDAFWFFILLRFKTRFLQLRGEFWNSETFNWCCLKTFEDSLGIYKLPACYSGQSNWAPKNMKRSVTRIFSSLSNLWLLFPHENKVDQFPAKLVNGHWGSFVHSSFFNYRNSDLLPFVASALKHRVKLNAQKGGKYSIVDPISIQFSPTWSKHFLPPSPPRLLGVEKPPRGFQVCRS